MVKINAVSVMYETGRSRKNFGPYPQWLYSSYKIAQLHFSLNYNYELLFQISV